MESLEFISTLNQTLLGCGNRMLSVSTHTDVKAVSVFLSFEWTCGQLRAWSEITNLLKVCAVLCEGSISPVMWRRAESATLVQLCFLSFIRYDNTFFFFFSEVNNNSCHWHFFPFTTLMIVYLCLFFPAAFLTQTVCLDDTTVKFEIWDTAGQERYHSLAPMYYRGAQAAIVVYDITNSVSYTEPDLCHCFADSCHSGWVDDCLVHENASDLCSSNLESQM